MHPYSNPRTLGALSSHRFLMRAGLSASIAFAWVFVLQYFYLAFGSLTDAFVHTIQMYALSQVVIVLLTPYSARQLLRGARSRMLAGAFLAMLALCALAAVFIGLLNIAGVIVFALFMGGYRALYWTPYILEREVSLTANSVPEEIFLAFMPAVAGLALLNGPLGATVLLVAAASIILASLAPLGRVPDIYEMFSWGYGETFAELFEEKYNPVVEPAFLQGLQGSALMLLWPLAVFVIGGFSYALLGLVLTATLLITLIVRSRAHSHVQKRPYIHAALAASSWLLRLIVATPVGVVLIDAYSSAGTRPGDFYALEQSADNGTYVDELTVLKEISQGIGRIAMCVATIVCIAALSVPLGLAIAFVIAAAASAISVFYTEKQILI